MSVAKSEYERCVKTTVQLDNERLTIPARRFPVESVIKSDGTLFLKEIFQNEKLEGGHISGLGRFADGRTSTSRYTPLSWEDMLRLRAN